eukprot:gene13934-21311_t
MDPLKPSTLTNRTPKKYAHVKSRVASVRRAAPHDDKPLPEKTAAAPAPELPPAAATPSRPTAASRFKPASGSKANRCATTPAKSAKPVKPACVLKPGQPKHPAKPHELMRVARRRTLSCVDDLPFLSKPASLDTIPGLKPALPAKPRRAAGAAGDRPAETGDAAAAIAPLPANAHTHPAALADDAKPSPEKVGEVQQAAQAPVEPALGPGSPLEYGARARYPNPLAGGWRPGPLLLKDEAEDASEDGAAERPTEDGPARSEPRPETPPNAAEEQHADDSDDLSMSVSDDTSWAAVPISPLTVSPTTSRGSVLGSAVPRKSTKSTPDRTLSLPKFATFKTPDTLKACRRPSTGRRSLASKLTVRTPKQHLRNQSPAPTASEASVPADCGAPALLPTEAAGVEPATVVDQLAADAANQKSQEPPSTPTGDIVGAEPPRDEGENTAGESSAQHPLSISPEAAADHSTEETPAIFPSDEGSTAALSSDADQDAVLCCDPKNGGCLGENEEAAAGNRAGSSDATCEEAPPAGREPAELRTASVGAESSGAAEIGRAGESVVFSSPEEAAAAATPAAADAAAAPPAGESLSAEGEEEEGGTCEPRPSAAAGGSAASSASAAGSPPAAGARKQEVEAAGAARSEGSEETSRGAVSATKGSSPGAAGGEAGKGAAGAESPVAGVLSPLSQGTPAALGCVADARGRLGSGGGPAVAHAAIEQCVRTAPPAGLTPVGCLLPSDEGDAAAFFSPAEKPALSPLAARLSLSASPEHARALGPGHVASSRPSPSASPGGGSDLDEERAASIALPVGSELDGPAEDSCAFESGHLASSRQPPSSSSPGAARAGGGSDPDEERAASIALPVGSELDGPAESSCVFESGAASSRPSPSLSFGAAIQTDGGSNLDEERTALPVGSELDVCAEDSCVIASDHIPSSALSPAGATQTDDGSNLDKEHTASIALSEQGVPAEDSCVESGQTASSRQSSSLSPGAATRTDGGSNLDIEHTASIALPVDSELDVPAENSCVASGQTASTSQSPTLSPVGGSNLDKELAASTPSPIDGGQDVEEPSPAISPSADRAGPGNKHPASSKRRMDGKQDAPSKKPRKEARQPTPPPSTPSDSRTAKKLFYSLSTPKKRPCPEEAAASAAKKSRSTLDKLDTMPYKQLQALCKKSDRE